jgi:hypothetical protein
MNARPRFYEMSIYELSRWVTQNDCLGFDPVGIDDLDDEEELEAMQELEAQADEIWAAMNEGKPLPVDKGAA